MFVPLLLPTKDRILQLNLFGVFVCLACGRALNVLEPRQFGIVLDRMSAVTSDVHLRSIMSEIVLFIFYRWIEAVLNYPAKRLLWTPIEQNADRSLQTAAYNHIMDLSRDFHTEKQSDELYTSISQGSSIINILETVIFRILPVFTDLVLAAIYLYDLPLDSTRSRVGQIAANSGLDIMSLGHIWPSRLLPHRYSSFGHQLGFCPNRLEFIALQRSSPERQPKSCMTVLAAGTQSLISTL